MTRGGKSVVGRIGAPRAPALRVLALALVACRGPDDAREADEVLASTPEIEARIERVAAALPAAVQVRGEPLEARSLTARMASHRVPAVSAAVIHDGKIEWARAWGLADVASGRAATPETRFQAASMSKPVAALAVLRLAERGEIDLDVDVDRQLVGWRLPRDPGTGKAAVTPRRLLSHTAGVSVHGFRGYAPGEPVPTLLEVLEGSGPANSPPIRVVGTPGAEWRYSGGGYTVLQRLLEDVTGRPFDAVMSELLNELGMTRSTYAQPLPPRLAREAATGYRTDGTPVAGSFHTYPEQAAAGLWTTPTDLARFALAVGRAVRGERGAVVSPETAREMVTAGAGEWGLGTAVEGRGATLRFRHGGANEGFRGELVGFPWREQGAVVMTNADGGAELATGMLFAIAREYGWPDVAPITVATVPLDALEAHAYVGEYRVDEAPDVLVVVRWRSGHLELRVGDGPPVELLPTGRDRFVIRTDGRPLRFERDSTGRVTTAIAYDTRATRRPGSESP